MKKTDLTPIDKWDKAVQGTRLVERDRRQHALYSDLPYTIHKDFPRLVRLVRLWHVAMRHDTGKPSSPTLNSLTGQCETLYYRVYGSVCYFGNAPCTWRY